MDSRLLVSSLCGLACLALAPAPVAWAGGPDGPIVEAPSPEPLISNGAPAMNCQWPTTVALFGGGGLCSGTLVHPEIVTTAAHCGFPSTITFGETVNTPRREVVVDHCLRNPAWSMSDNNGVNANDYAYCKLAQPVYDIPFTPPVYGCEIEILSPGRAATIVGFGNNEGDNGAGTKRWAETTIQTVVGEFTETVVVGTVGTAACSGDSGGPAYVQYPDGSWHAFATVSGGPPCGAGGDTYTLIYKAVPWIEENSGVDITPCHDVDGTWNPTPACQGFALDPLDTEVAWTEWCATPRLGPSATCGAAFNAEPDDIAPTVTITAPADGSMFDGPMATLDILIDALDDGHGVSTVTLKINGEVIATDDREAWEFANAQFPEGGWILTAVAEDWNGNITESEPVAIGVGQPPPELPGDDTGDGDSGGDDDGGTSGFLDSDDTGVVGLDDANGCACTTDDNDETGWPAVFGLLALLGLRRRRD